MGFGRRRAGSQGAAGEEAAGFQKKLGAAGNLGSYLVCASWQVREVGNCTLCKDGCIKKEAVVRGERGRWLRALRVNTAGGRDLQI